MSRHLITGGAGFVGSALAHRLVAEGHEVTVLDRFSRGKRGRVPQGGADDCGRYPEPRSRSAMPWMNRTRSGISPTCRERRRSTRTPRTSSTWRCAGIMNVLERCEEQAERTPELFLVSSSEVYQNPPEGMFPTDETVPLSVPDVTNPRYSYGGGKIASELATLAYAQAGILSRAVIVRPHNIYGPDMGNEHVIPEFAERMMALPADEHRFRSRERDRRRGRSAISTTASTG